MGWDLMGWDLMGCYSPGRSAAGQLAPENGGKREAYQIVDSLPSLAGADQGRGVLPAVAGCVVWCVVRDVDCVPRGVACGVWRVACGV